MELTNEIKLKIFALYLECVCAVMGCETPQILTSVDLHSQTVETCESVDTVDPAYSELTDVKLILTPLEQISDEDVKELWAQLELNPDYEDECNYPGMTCKSYFLQHFKDHLEGGTNQVRRFDFIQNIQIIDFLRSKGYHLQYLGINLYEAGIAIPPTDNK